MSSARQMVSAEVYSTGRYRTSTIQCSLYGTIQVSAPPVYFHNKEHHQRCAAGHCTLPHSVRSFHM